MTPTVHSLQGRQCLKPTQSGHSGRTAKVTAFDSLATLGASAFWRCAKVCCWRWADVYLLRRALELAVKENPIIRRPSNLAGSVCVADLQAVPSDFTTGHRVALQKFGTFEFTGESLRRLTPHCSL